MNRQPLVAALAGLLALSVVSGGSAGAEERGERSSIEVTAVAEPTPLSIAARRAARSGHDVRIIVTAGSRDSLARLGVRIGRRVGTLPQFRAVASGDALSRVISSGLAHEVRVDRWIPKPQPYRQSGAVPAFDDPATPAADIIGASALRAGGVTGKGTAVAVLDTGIDAGHPYFRRGSGSAIVAQGCFVENSADYPPDLPCPGRKSVVIGRNAADIGSRMDFSHGTHVAGIIAGDPTGIPAAKSTWGIAPGTNLVIARVFGSSGALDSDIIAALDWVRSIAREHNIVAVNLSLGYFGGDRWDCARETDVVYGSIVRRLAEVGVAVVAASGNDGSTRREGSPACGSGVTSVGATEADGTIAEYSNIAPATDLVAPGSDVLSSVPGGSFERYFGTSMATPVVAGAFALAHQAKKGLSQEAWVAQFRATGDDVNDLVVKGIPLIQVDRATRAAQGMGLPGRPSGVAVKEIGLSSVQVTWVAPKGKARPEDYVVTVGAKSVVVKTTSVTVSGVLSSPAQVKVVPRVGGIPGPSAVGPDAFPVDPSLGSFAPLSISASVLPRWGYCDPASPSLSLIYQGPEGAPLRTLRVANDSVMEIVNESSPMKPFDGDRAITISRQELWSDPSTVVQVMGTNGQLGPRWSLGYYVVSVEGLTPPPPRPTDVSAAGRPGLIDVTWSGNGATSWEIFLDGKSAMTTSVPRATLIAPAGQHQVGVCALGDSSEQVFGSVVTTVPAVVP